MASAKVAIVYDMNEYIYDILKNLPDDTMAWIENHEGIRISLDKGISRRDIDNILSIVHINSLDVILEGIDNFDDLIFNENEIMSPLCFPDNHIWERLSSLF